MHININLKIHTKKQQPTFIFLMDTGQLNKGSCILEADGVAQENQDVIKD